MDPAAILITSSIIIMFLTLVGISYKTGFVSYSIWSLTRSDQPIYTIKKDKAGTLMQISAGILVLNIAYCFLIDRNINDIGAILVLSLFNTAVISYGLSFWILLKEKNKA